MSAQSSLVRALCLLCSAAALLASLGTAADAQLAPSAWPMYHHDPQHTGRTDNFLGPLYPSGAPNPTTDVHVWWGWDKILTSPAVDRDGTIYVGLAFSFCAINPEPAADGLLKTKWCTGLLADVSASSPAIDYNPLTGKTTVYVGDRDNTVTAFNAADGTVKWRWNTGREGDVLNSVTLVSPDPTGLTRATLYFAHSQSTDGYGVVTALNPDGAVAGPPSNPILQLSARKWKHVIGQMVGFSSAAYANGVIYIGAGAGALYAFDAVTGAQKWAKPLGLIAASPVIANNTIYLGSSNGFHALDTNGNLLWTYLPLGAVYQTAAVGADGTLYFGATVSNYVTFYALAPCPSVGCTPTLKWKYGPFPLGGPALPLIAADGTIYVGMGTGIYAFRPDGTLLWKYFTTNYLSAMPSLGGNATTAAGGKAVIYLPSLDHKLYAVSSTRASIGSHTPTAHITFSPTTIEVGELVQFHANASDPDSTDTLTYAWDFDDGTTSSDANPTHTYWTAGTYNVTLDVSDGIHTFHTSVDVTVSEGPPLSFCDNFNRSILGNTWATPDNSFIISNNELQNAPVHGNHIAIVNGLSGPPQQAEADFATVYNATGPRLGIVLRYQDPQNYYLVSRVAGPSSLLLISKVVNGVETFLRGATIWNPVPNTFFHMKGIANGNTLSVVVTPGIGTLSATDSTFPGGGVGIMLGTGAGALPDRADNFAALIGAGSPCVP
jgi:outer membrane protein assembly factor BamB